MAIAAPIAAPLAAPIEAPVTSFGGPSIAAQFDTIVGFEHLWMLANGSDTDLKGNVTFTKNAGVNPVAVTPSDVPATDLLTAAHSFTTTSARIDFAGGSIQCDNTPFLLWLHLIITGSVASRALIGVRDGSPFEGWEAKTGGTTGQIVTAIGDGTSNNTSANSAGTTGSYFTVGFLYDPLGSGNLHHAVSHDATVISVGAFGGTNCTSTVETESIGQNRLNSAVWKLAAAGCVRNAGLTSMSTATLKSKVDAINARFKTAP